MKLLFLAPQPFFQDRGTPIAVRLALQVLAERVMHGQHAAIDLLTYHEGVDVPIPNVTIHRIKAPAWISGVGPGISVKKLLCDLIFLFSALKLVWKNRHERYDLVHAVEEAVFIAWLIKFFFGIPYIYDMDSSLVMQLCEKWPVCKILSPLLNWFERLAVTSSIAVVPVCDALAAIAQKHGSKETLILRDISLLGNGGPKVRSLKEEVSYGPQDTLILYVGNLEPYQGIDLLFESFAIVAQQDVHAKLVIIGGNAGHIASYTAKAQSLGIAQRTLMLGQRPVDSLSAYIMDADILVSPRIKGNNTPMKIYSYLHSGKPIVATDLVTHTQVLSDKVAILTKPVADDFSRGLLKLIRDPALRSELGKQGAALAEDQYTFEVFKARLNGLYDRLVGKNEPVGIKSSSSQSAAMGG